jgi:hypothetical protein
MTTINTSSMDTIATSTTSGSTTSINQHQINLLHNKMTFEDHLKLVYQVSYNKNYDYVSCFFFFFFFFFFFLSQ